jgi:hypothetical protein
MTMAERLLRLFFAACVIALLSGCPQTSPKELSRSEFVFGAECTIRLAGGGSEMLDAVFARLRQFSLWAERKAWLSPGRRASTPSS